PFLRPDKRFARPGWRRDRASNPTKRASGVARGRDERERPRLASPSGGAVIGRMGARAGTDGVFRSGAVSPRMRVSRRGPEPTPPASEEQERRTMEQTMN